MLVGVAIISVLLALMTSVGPLPAFGLLLLALSIVAHVAGNALGTRLRENGSRPLDGKPGEPVFSLTAQRPPVAAADFAPTTRLGAKHPLGWLVIVATGLGIVLGASLGGVFLAWLCWERITLVGMICGAAASGALGGFGGFLVCSFVRTAAGPCSGHRRSANVTTHW